MQQYDGPTTSKIEVITYLRVITLTCYSKPNAKQQSVREVGDGEEKNVRQCYY